MCGFMSRPYPVKLGFRPASSISVRPGPQPMSRTDLKPSCATRFDDEAQPRTAKVCICSGMRGRVNKLGTPGRITQHARQLDGVAAVRPYVLLEVESGLGGVIRGHAVSSLTFGDEGGFESDQVQQRPQGVFPEAVFAG